jgi:hypothetical protein
MREKRFGLLAIAALAFSFATPTFAAHVADRDVSEQAVRAAKAPSILDIAADFVIPSAHAQVSASPIPAPDSPPPPPSVSGPDLPDTDPLLLIGQLLANWKTLGPLGIGMALVLLAGQAIKMYSGDFKYKRLTILSLSCVYATMLGISHGQDPVSVVVSVLFTTGGAMALYEALKGAGIIKSSKA